IARRIWQQASAEPIASPSGRACEVSTNRSRRSNCRRTSCKMVLMPFSSLVRREALFVFLPAPTILLPALFPVPNDPAENTILARASSATAPLIHAVYILSQRAAPQGFAPLPGRRHQHRPEPALSARRPRQAPR